MKGDRKCDVCGKSPALWRDVAAGAWRCDLCVEDEAVLDAVAKDVRRADKRKPLKERR